MPGEPFEIRYWSKLGGINNSLSDEFIVTDSELSDGRNFQPDEQTSGVLIKREGTVRTSSAIGANITSIYQGANGNYFTVPQFIYNFSGTGLTGALGLSTYYPSWTTMAVYDIMADGVQVMKTSNGTTFTALAGVPGGTRYVCSVNNFLYASGGDGHLRWANIGTAETWPTTNDLTLTADTADNITGLAPWRNAVFVGSAKSFRLVTGYTSLEQAVSYYSKEEGCLSHRSIVVTPMGLMWWSRRGATVLREEMTLDFPMQRKLQGTLYGLNRAMDGSVHAVHDPTRKRVMFFLFNGVSTTCSLRADYFYYDDAWYLHDAAGVRMNSSGSALISGVVDVYAGGYGATNGYLFKYSGATDDGVFINSWLETAREAYGSSAVLKIGRKASISTDLTTPETILYGVYVDNATILTDTYSIAVVAGGVDTRIGVNRAHYKIKHMISDTATSRTRIYGIKHDGYVVKTV